MTKKKHQRMDQLYSGAYTPIEKISLQSGGGEGGLLSRCSSNHGDIIIIVVVVIVVSVLKEATPFLFFSFLG